MISILLPTRKRLPALLQTVRTLYSLAARPEQLELVLRVDADDPTDYSDFRWRMNTQLIVGPRWGYKGMHLYYDEVSRAATKPWLLIWNDDMFMLTERWDEVLLSRGADKMHVQFLKRDTYGPEVPGDPYQNTDTACPFYPKAMYELMGRTGCNAHVDSWLDYVSEALKIKTFRHDVIYHHDRPEDETAHERVFDWEAFQTAENANERATDVARIAEYLSRHPETRP